MAGYVLLFKEAPGKVETAELDGYAGADADKGCECAFVKGEGAFVAVDACGGGEGGEVGGGCLEADFDYVKRLA